MRSLPSLFVCQPGRRSAQWRGGVRLLVAMHLLVISSLLFSTTAAAMPLSKPGSRAADATQRTLARPRPSATDTNQSQPFLSLAMTANPEAAAIGERVLLRWEVMNLDSQDVTLTGVYPERSRRDAENRLTAMSGGVTSSYVYDADGNRVTAVVGSSTTVYVGAYYEKTTSGSSTTITKYYQAGGQRTCRELSRTVAMRVNGVVRWLTTDHPSTKLRTGLGSTSITANEAGARMSELRYKPWGESRGIPFGTTPTQRRLFDKLRAGFTGQVLDEVAGGLYFYNARYYDPALGRFAQADTIVPNPGNPQNLNRYSYALGNPLRFVDPSGIDPLDQAWHDLLGVSRAELEAASRDPGQLAKLQDAFVQIGQQTSRASNYIGVQAQGQRVFVDTSNKVVSIVQGDRFLSLYRITEWEQFALSMKDKGLQLAPGVDWEAIRLAMGL